MNFKKLRPLYLKRAEYYIPEDTIVINDLSHNIKRNLLLRRRLGCDGSEVLEFEGKVMVEELRRMPRPVGGELHFAVLC